MYSPCFVFPYQRVPYLWYTPVSVLIHIIPALGAAAGVIVAGGLSVPLDCGDCACSVETLTTAAARTSRIATSRARDGFFVLRFIVVRLNGVFFR